MVFKPITREMIDKNESFIEVDRVIDWDDISPYEDENSYIQHICSQLSINPAGITDIIIEEDIIGRLFIPVRDERQR